MILNQQSFLSKWLRGGGQNNLHCLFATQKEQLRLVWKRLWTHKLEPWGTTVTGKARVRWQMETAEGYFSACPCCTKVIPEKAESTTPQNSKPIRMNPWISKLNIVDKHEKSPHSLHTVKAPYPIAVGFFQWLFSWSPKSQRILFFCSHCSFVFYCCIEGNCFRLIDKSMRRLIVAALHGSAEGKLSVVMQCWKDADGMGECEAIKPNRKQEVRCDGSVMQNTESKAER